MYTSLVQAIVVSYCSFFASQKWAWPEIRPLQLKWGPGIFVPTGTLTGSFQQKTLCYQGVPKFIQIVQDLTRLLVGFVSVYLGLG